MPTKKTTKRPPARRALTDHHARNVAAAAYEQVEQLKARLAKLEKRADRVASLVDDHIAGLV